MQTDRGSKLKMLDLPANPRGALNKGQAMHWLRMRIYF